MRHPSPGRRGGVRSLFGIALLAIAWGCGEPTAREGTDASDTPTEIRIGLHSDILSFDPHRYNEMLSFAVLRNLYEPLMTFDSRLRIVPSLVESWENPDELTWRFDLRRGVEFHDGRSLDAGDVVFSLERVRKHPDSGLASYLVQVEDVVAVDEHTVEIRTKRPFPILLNKLAYLMIVPAGSPDEIRSPVGTGAYRFERWEPGEALTLRAFDGYWRGRPEIDRAVFVPVRDPEERVRLLLEGSLDLVREVAPWLADRAGESRAIRLERTPALSVSYLHLHPAHEPFEDPRVRRAVDLALDRERLVADILHGHGRAVGQLVSSDVFGFDPALGVTGTDRDEARRLLAEAGYPDGFRTTLVTREGRNPGPIAAQLATVGIDVEIRMTAWTDLYPRMSEERIPFYYGAVVASSGDASDVLDTKGHTRDPAAGYGNTNFAGYSDPAVDELVERSGTTLEMIPRRELLQEAMRGVVESRIYVPLFVSFDLYGIRQDIEWQPRIDSVMLVQEMSRRPPTTGSRR